MCFECITCICLNGFLIMYSWTLPCNVDIDSCNVHVPGLKSINPYHIIDLLGKEKLYIQVYIYNIDTESMTDIDSEKENTIGNIQL